MWAVTWVKSSWWSGDDLCCRLYHVICIFYLVMFYWLKSFSVLNSNILNLLELLSWESQNSIRRNSGSSIGFALFRCGSHWFGPDIVLNIMGQLLQPRYITTKSSLLILITGHDEQIQGLVYNNGILSRITVFLITYGSLSTYSRVLIRNSW